MVQTTLVNQHGKARQITGQVIGTGISKWRDLNEEKDKEIHQLINNLKMYSVLKHWTSDLQKLETA